MTNNLDFKDKTILITGGTGSFGNTVLSSLLDTNVKELRIFSRDEKKQDDLRKKFLDERVKFYLGDVRDYGSILNAVQGVDYIFHAAALKQVPSCEFYPMEAVKTNILGTENLINAAIESEVSRVVCLSTDKAVYPINAMGISKAMMEKILVSKTRNLNASTTIGCCTRYGNVMASRGSVIPLFIDQILSGEPITITDPNMTRFMMSLEESVNLVFHAFGNGDNGDIFVQKAPATTIQIVVDALLELFDRKEHPVKIIGTRHGEKLFETLLSREEMARVEDQGAYYRVLPDMRDLNYSMYFESGEKSISELTDYTSHITEQLNVDQTKDLLKSLEFVQKALAGEYEPSKG
jgi:UDP-N-acetylglucosamine 4,6-dehydratase/5-epimerase